MQLGLGDFPQMHSHWGQRRPRMPGMNNCCVSFIDFFFSKRGVEGEPLEPALNSSFSTWSPKRSNGGQISTAYCFQRCAFPLLPNPFTLSRDIQASVCCLFSEFRVTSSTCTHKDPTGPPAFVPPPSLTLHTVEPLSQSSAITFTAP